MRRGASQDDSAPEQTVATGPAPSRAPGPRIPERLGPYLLLDEVGRGGMGIVFRARHATLGTECAVKVLVAGEHASEESIARFHREAAGVARLGKHPNIVHVFDLGWEGSLAYYAMELIGGRSLRQVLRERLLEVREAAGLMERVARALHFAHTHGLVHRDVKPNNILLRDDGEPQIVDFGLAREVGSVEQWSVTGDIMGTPEYMSPEQAGGRVDLTDARTDVYALGAVLYECLAGIPPHRGETWPELLHEILEGDVVPPGKLRHGIPRDLETVCLKCLEVRREARYDTAEALADDLARVRNGEPVRARPVSAIERLRRRVARNWRVVLPTTLAGVLALGIGAWFLAMTTRDAGALASAIEMGRKYRAEGRPREARDMYHEARRVDRDCAEAVDGVRWADGELARIDREAEDARRRAAEAEALLAESRRVLQVLGRWSRLRRPLRELERWGYSSLPSEEMHAKTLRAWTTVEAFMKETPGDPASRATMLGLAGWARRLAGYPDEGIAMMREAARTDPNVPYGPLLEALVHFSRSMEAYPLPEISIGELGLEVGAAPEAPVEVAAERDQVPALLEQARRARIFGEEGVEGFGVAIEAMSAMQEGRYEEAERRLGDALERPELLAFESGLLLARARARFLQKKTDVALEDLRDVVAARAEQPEARLLLGQVLYAEALALFVSKADPSPALTEALEAFTTAEALRPGGIAALNNRGNVQLCRGDVESFAGRSPLEHYARAIEDFDEVLRRSPTLGTAWNNRGNTHARLGEWIENQGKDPREEYRLAIADFDRTLSIDPTYAFGRYNRAKVRACLAHVERVRGGDPEPDLRAAGEDYDAYLRARPQDPAALVARALVDLERGIAKAGRGEDPREEYGATIEALERVVAARPTFAKARYNLGHVRSKLADWEADHEGDFRAAYARALAEFDEMIRIAPDDPSAFKGRGLARLGLAEALLARGETVEKVLSQGIEDVDAALARGTSPLPAHAQLGRARLRLAEVLRNRGADPVETLRASVRSFDEAIRIAPDSVALRAERGEARSTLAASFAAREEDARDLARAAIDDLDAALRADPEDTASLYRRGIMRCTIASREAREGKASEETLRAAIQDLGEVARRDPDNADAQFYRGAAFEMLGSDAEAAKAYERALAVEPGHGGAAERLRLIREKLGGGEK